MTIVEKFKTNPLQKIVILAPTKPLIEQHLKSFQEKLPDGWADMQLFTGATNAEKRKKIWQTAEFIFSTPQCIANDIQKELYSLHDVSLVVVDEAHRCVKNYAYNKIVQRYKIQNDNHHILALTASPGGDKETIKEICDNLNIQAVEIRTRESPDVAPHLQELEFEKVMVEYPTELMEIRMLIEGLYNSKVEELKKRRLASGNVTKMTLLKLQGRLMGEITKNKGSKNAGYKMKAVSVTAQALKISHALELIETQTVQAFTEYMRDMYKQAAEKKSKGVQMLTTDKRFARAFTLATTLSREHPKIHKLEEVVEEQVRENPEAKVIVFAQFRETVAKITEVLNNIRGIEAGSFVGQAQKTNSRGKTTGLKQKEQKKVVDDFREGKINVLVATSIAEEGLDIPEVSAVIFYEPIPSAIRTIQRAGRTARLAPGQLKILITKNTRDEAYYYTSYHKEKRMHKAIDSIKKGFEGKEIRPKERQETLL
jgi:ERCC4-related helicase